MFLFYHGIHDTSDMVSLSGDEASWPGDAFLERQVEISINKERGNSWHGFMMSEKSYIWSTKTAEKTIIKNNVSPVEKRQEVSLQDEITDALLAKKDRWIDEEKKEIAWLLQNLVGSETDGMADIDEEVSDLQVSNVVWGLTKQTTPESILSLIHYEAQNKNGMLHVSTTLRNEGTHAYSISDDTPVWVSCYIDFGEGIRYRGEIESYLNRDHAWETINIGDDDFMFAIDTDIVYDTFIKDAESIGAKFVCELLGV